MSFLFLLLLLLIGGVSALLFWLMRTSLFFLVAAVFLLLMISDVSFRLRGRERNVVRSAELYFGISGVVVLCCC